MRLKLISLATLFVPMFALAAPVDRTEAARVAAEFMKNRRQGTITEIECTYAHSRQRKIQGQTADGRDAAYYVFGGADNSGFVIISGDDRLPAVIGYSDTGHFDTSDMPEACRAWLDAIARTVENMSDESVENGNVKETVAYPATAVAPMLTSTWDQGAPYNAQTPTVDGTETLTGCVATATAQIMYYHRWPERPNGFISYKDNNELRTMNFDAQPAFEWDKILPVYTSAASANSCAAVAHLMQCVGYGSKMSYGKDVSVALCKNAAEGLYKYFGYDVNIHRYERGKMSDAEWVDIITGELYAGRPVLYDGYGSNAGVGHTFVCDGYDGNGMFHFNWGWSGMCDGYFSLSALSPKTQGAGGLADSYTFNQAIECHIQPAGKGISIPQESHLLWIYDLNVYIERNVYKTSENEVVKASAVQNSGFVFYGMSSGHNDFSGEVCAAIITGNGINPIVSTVQSIQIPAGDYKQLQFSINPEETGNGTFRIGFFYRTTSTGEWQQIDVNLYGQKESYVTVDDDFITYNRLQPTTHVSMQSMGGVSERMYAGYEYDIDLKVINDGETRLDGCIGVMISKAGNAGEAVFTTSRVFIAEGEHGEAALALNLRDTEPGDYLLTPVYATAATATTATAITMGDPRRITVEANSGVGVMAPQTGYYIIERPATGFGITLMKTLAGDWQGKVVACVDLSGNDTGVMLTTDKLSMSGMATGYATEVKGDMSSLMSNTLYNLTFTLDTPAGPQVGTGKLVLTGVESGINNVSDNPHSVIAGISGGVLRVNAGSIINRITVTDMQGRMIMNIATDGHEAVIPVHGVPEGIYIIGISTLTGKTAISVRK